MIQAALRIGLNRPDDKGEPSFLASLTLDTTNLQSYSNRGETRYLPTRARGQMSSLGTNLVLGWEYFCTVQGLFENVLGYLFHKSASDPGHLEALKRDL